MFIFTVDCDMMYPALVYLGMWDTVGEAAGLTGLISLSVYRQSTSQAVRQAQKAADSMDSALMTRKVNRTASV